MAKVSIMGSDLQDQLALLQQLQAMTASPGLSVDLCHELADCDLLVFYDSPVQRLAARRIVANHPWLPVWSVADNGMICDALCDPPAPLEHHQISTTLQRLHLIAASTQSVAPPPAPVDTLGPSPAEEPASAPDPGPLGEAIRARLRSASTVAALGLDGHDLLLLDFRRLLAIVAPEVERQGDAAAQLLGQRFSALSVRTLPAAQYSALFVEQPSQPMIPLLWQAALRMQVEPELLAPLHEGCTFRLKRWPDFRVLAHRHDDFRLCQLLLHQGCTVLEASHALGIDPGAARAFFNAAWLTDYAQVEWERVAAPERAAVSKPEASTLLGRMWKGVRGTKDR